MSLPSLASSRASLYMPLASSADSSARTGPSVSEAKSRTALRKSTPSARAPETDNQTPSSRPRSLIRRASSALALPRKNRMRPGFYMGPGPGPRSGLVFVVVEKVGLVLLGLWTWDLRLGTFSRPRQRGLRLLVALVVFGELGDGDDAVALLELDDTDALRGPPGLPDVADLDPDELPALGDQQELIGVDDGLD